MLKICPPEKQGVIKDKPNLIPTPTFMGKTVSSSQTKLRCKEIKKLCEEGRAVRGVGGGC